jgi:hypothetical protein
VKPQQSAQAYAEAQAYQVAAHNIARSCSIAVEHYKLEHGGSLDPSWHGKSCLEAGLLSVESNAAIENSLVTLHQKTQEGYQITVWPKLSGEPVIVPDTPTPKRFELGVASSWVFALSLTTFAFCLALALAVFVLPGYIILAMIGSLVFLLAITALVFSIFHVRTYPGNKFNQMFIGIPVTVLAVGLCFAVPRFAYRFVNEQWWISLGTGMIFSLPIVLIAVLPAGLLVIGYLASYLFHFKAVYILPVLSLLLTLWILLHR